MSAASEVTATVLSYAEAWRLAVQATIAVGAAFLAADLATKRFRHDKLWEKKMTAYSELVEALHRMQWPPMELFEAGLVGRSIAEGEREEMWTDFRAARRNVWRIAEQSSFLLSPKALEAVQQMERELEGARGASSGMEGMHLEVKAIDRCLESIKSLGVTELRIPNPRSGLRRWKWLKPRKT